MLNKLFCIMVCTAILTLMATYRQPAAASGPCGGVTKYDMRKAGGMEAALIGRADVHGVASQPPCPGRSVDVRNMDVRGMRLGMTPDQIVKALRPIMETEGEIRREPTLCVSDSVTSLRAHGAPVPAHCTSMVSLGQIVVSFVEDFPRDPGVMRAFSIFYHQRDLDIRTAADVQVFEQAIRAKYGAPTTTNGRVMVYCVVHPPQRDDCLQDKPLAYMYSGYLVADPAHGLELHDNRYFVERNAAIARKLATVRTQNIEHVEL